MHLGWKAFTLGDGFEEIRREAFEECTSLERIIIPNAVKVIDDYRCARLTNVVIGNEIMEFVSCEAM